MTSKKQKQKGKRECYKSKMKDIEQISCKNKKAVKRKEKIMEKIEKENNGG